MKNFIKINKAHIKLYMKKLKKKENMIIYQNIQLYLQFMFAIIYDVL